MGTGVVPLSAPTKKANIKRYRERNPEAVRESLRGQYYRNPAPYKQAATQRGKKLKSQYDNLCPLHQRLVDFIYCQANHLCEEHGRRSFHVDHKIPLNSGGWHHPDNLRVVCSSRKPQQGAKPLA